MTYRNDEERILSNIEVDANGCWLWKNHTDRYGILMRNKKVIKVHRLAFEVFRRPIPAGLYVLHKCDVPRCCNPAHLFLGTQTDNMRDCANKGRITPPSCPTQKKARGDSNGMRKHPGLLSGEKNGRSKVTDKDRDEIRRLRLAGVRRNALAAMYGIHASQIYRICKR